MIYNSVDGLNEFDRWLSSKGVAGGGGSSSEFVENMPHWVRREEPERNPVKKGIHGLTCY